MVLSFQPIWSGELEQSLDWPLHDGVLGGWVTRHDCLGREGFGVGRSHWTGEKAAAFSNEARGNTASTTIKSSGGKMGNGTSALSNVVAVAMSRVTPVAVEFVDSKSNESCMTDFLIIPLEAIEAKQDKFIEVFPRH